MKDKMQKFIDFLNSEEITALKKSMDIDWVREEMKKANAAETAKLVVGRVVHHYVGLDRMFIITEEQQKRWHEVENKARELVITKE